MINKEEFISLIANYRKWDKRMDQIQDVLNANLFETDWVEYTNNLFDTLIKLEFNEYGVDDINWWLFEKNGNPTLKMWDSKHNEIPTDSIEDLWDIVKDYRK